MCHQGDGGVLPRGQRCASGRAEECFPGVGRLAAGIAEPLCVSAVLVSCRCASFLPAFARSVNVILFLQLALPRSVRYVFYVIYRVEIQLIKGKGAVKTG